MYLNEENYLTPVGQQIFTITCQHVLLCCLHDMRGENLFYNTVACQG